MCAKHTSRRDRPEQDLTFDPDALPTGEYLAVEADLELETDEFGTEVERLMEREISDRKTAEDALDVVEAWLLRIAKVEENPFLSKLSDVEMFNLTSHSEKRSVAPTVIIRHWMGRGDNLERLMAFRDAVDQQRFDLPDQPAT